MEEARTIKPAAREKILHLLAISVFASVFYINSLGNFFVWNDWTLIIENFLIKDWWNLPEIFSSVFWKPLIGEPLQIYRPLTFLTLMSDFLLWGFRAWGYHLTNIALHAGNSVLIYFLVRGYAPAMIALMASLLFAAHPIQSEAVAYIAGRGELLMSLFVLSGTLLFLRSIKQGSPILYLASLALFFCAMLAKETAVMFPLFLMAADLTSPRQSHCGGVQRLGRHAGPVFIVGLYALLRSSYVDFIPTSPLALPNFLFHLQVVLQAVPLYIGLLVFPFDLHVFHRLNPSLLNLSVWLGLFLLVIAGWIVRRTLGTDRKAAAFAILWFLIGLLPVVHLTGSNLPLVESWVYFASGGFFVLAAIGLARLEKWFPSQARVWLVVLIAVLLGALTLRRTHDWKDEVQISLHTLNASPDDPIALRLLGNAQFRRARVPEAERLFQKALALAPGDPRLHESLARLYSFLGKDAEAAAHYRHMRELAPGDPYPHWRSGRYQLNRRNLAEAERYFTDAARLFPYSSEIRNDLATTYYLQGKFAAARSELEAALEMAPSSEVLRNNLERLDRKKGSSSPTLPSQ